MIQANADYKTYDCVKCHDTGHLIDSDGVEIVCPVCLGHTSAAAINVRNVPRGLRSQFKSWCSSQGVTMQDFIVQAIRKAVNGGSEI